MRMEEEPHKEQKCLIKKEEKSFQFKNYVCLYQNQITSQPSQNAPSTYLVNERVECKQNQVQKKYTFNLGSYIIEIQDIYTLETSFNFQPTVTSESHHKKPEKIKSEKITNKSPEKGGQNNEQKKIVLFKNKQKSEVKYEKGDKKNIVKNVITAFQNYLKQSNDSSLPNDVLKQLVSAHHYTNNLINQIIKESQLRFYFKQFLSQKAVEWIEQSKLKNKEIHLEAVKVYEDLCQHKSQEEEQEEREKCSNAKVSPDESNNYNYYFQSALNNDLEKQIQGFK